MEEFGIEHRNEKNENVISAPILNFVFEETYFATSECNNSANAQIQLMIYNCEP